MKKRFFLTIFVFLALILSGCVLVPEKPKESDQQTSLKGNYTGSYYQGNYVWGGAMNLAWTEMSQNIIKDKVELNTTDEKTLEIMDKLNNPVFTKVDMDKESYYVKSGFGQEAVKVINKECKQKFPDKSFSDLDVDLGDKDFISYAYFLKEVEYLVEFNKKDVNFNGSPVKGFYALNNEQAKNVKVLQYWNDDKFIISLNLKRGDENLIVAKGFNMEEPEEIVEEISKYSEGETMSSDERFEMPELHLDYNRNYTEMEGVQFANSGWEEYSISKMFENIKFDMDYKGARVENEAVIVGTTSIGPTEVRNFILDKPFWVVMKRSDKTNPYFMLGVNNTELMLSN